MKKVIRKNCFETNSSSQHVICVTKNDTHIKPEEFNWDYKTNSDECPDEYIYFWKDGKWTLHKVSDGFGRSPFKMLTTFKDKFRYALCEFCGGFYGDEDEFYAEFNKLEDLAKEIVPGVESLDIDKRYVDIYVDDDGNEVKHKDLIFESWAEADDVAQYSYLDANGNRKMAHFDSENYYEVPAIGMIDHQSMGLLKGFLKNEGISLKEFLTNKKYVIIIDGDEYDYWERYKRSGLINTSFILKEYHGSGRG